MSMTELVCEQYGSPEVLKFAELPRPSPGKGEILIRVMGVIVGTAEARTDNLEHLCELVRQGRFRSVIALVLPFNEALDAHCYADHASYAGSVVIKMGDIGDNGEVPL